MGSMIVLAYAAHHKPTFLLCNEIW